MTATKERVADRGSFAAAAANAQLMVTHSMIVYDHPR
jgi:hypothetical protein